MVRQYLECDQSWKPYMRWKYTWNTSKMTYTIKGSSTYIPAPKELVNEYIWLQYMRTNSYYLFA
jgi:hypothetical protein